MRPSLREKTTKIIVAIKIIISHIIEQHDAHKNLDKNLQIHIFSISVSFELIENPLRLDPTKMKRTYFRIYKTKDNDKPLRKV